MWTFLNPLSTRDYQGPQEQSQPAIERPAITPATGIDTPDLPIRPNLDVPTLMAPRRRSQRLWRQTV